MKGQHGPVHPSPWAIKKASIKSEKITSAGKDVEKWGPLCSVDGIVKRGKPLWKTV